jgi:hypothetical protein
MAISPRLSRAPPILFYVADPVNCARVDPALAFGLGSPRAGQRHGGQNLSVLRITSGPAAGTSQELDAEVVVGRENADLTIEDSEMSRRHASLRPAPDGVVVEDLGSMNGTFIDGRRIAEPVTLTASATIRMGKSEMALEVAAAVPTDEPIVNITQDTRARDVPVVDVDDATRARDIPVADVDESTRARDIPVADVDDSTRARDIPVADMDATRARDIPVADVEATRARDIPVGDVTQPTTARSSQPGRSGDDAQAKGSPLTTTVAGLPVLVFAILGAIVLVVLLVVLFG